MVVVWVELIRVENKYGSVFGGLIGLVSSLVS